MTLDERIEEFWSHHTAYYVGILQYDADHVLRIKEEWRQDLNAIIEQAKQEKEEQK
jgi:hypothetical protein